MAARHKYTIRETEGNLGKRQQEIQYSRWDIRENVKHEAATNGIRYHRR